MDSALEPRVRATTVQLLRWLVAGDYAAIEHFTAGVRMPSAEIQESVNKYGRTLIMPPERSLDDLDVIDIAPEVCRGRRQWSVRVALWTVEEGRSDLSMECTMIDRSGDLLGVEMDNIIVF